MANWRAGSLHDRVGYALDVSGKGGIAVAAYEEERDLMHLRYSDLSHRTTNGAPLHYKSSYVSEERPVIAYGRFDDGTTEFWFDMNQGVAWHCAGGLNPMKRLVSSAEPRRFLASNDSMGSDEDGSLQPHE